MLVPAEEYCGDIAGSRPHSSVKASGAISQLREVFWFPSACKCYVHTVLELIQCAIELCLKKLIL